MKRIILATFFSWLLCNFGVTQNVLNENFDQSRMLPPGWNQQQIITDNASISVSSGLCALSNEFIASDHTGGGRFIYTLGNSYIDPGHIFDFITPPLDLSSGHDSIVFYSFVPAGQTQSLYVKIGFPYTMSLPDSIRTINLLTVSPGETQWTKHKIDLSSYGYAALAYIIFSSDNGKYALDDVYGPPLHVYDGVKGIANTTSWFYDGDGYALIDFYCAYAGQEKDSLEFRIRNFGDETLTLSNPSFSVSPYSVNCQYFSSSFTGSDINVPPSEDTTIFFSIHPEVSGYYDCHYIVSTNDPNLNDYDIELRANVGEYVSFSSSELPSGFTASDGWSIVEDSGPIKNHILRCSSSSLKDSLITPRLYMGKGEHYLIISWKTSTSSKSVPTDSVIIKLSTNGLSYWTKKGIVGNIVQSSWHQDTIFLSNDKLNSYDNCYIKFNYVGDGSGSATDFYVRYMIIPAIQATVGSADDLQNQISNLSFEILPNPTSKTMELSLDMVLGDFEVNIVNMQGKLMYSEFIKNSSQSCRKSIDVSEYSSGIYLVKIKDMNNTCVKKALIY